MTLPFWTWEFHDVGPQPDVSVVICAYGKVGMTLECLWSIHEAQGSNSAQVEVIVVDDASPDNTAAVLSQLRGLKLVSLTSNEGYLGAANRGIEAASGRHILLLNNDTLPQGRWIDPLLETLEQRGAGAVGARLVFDDGSVQEAGSIIFSDGSGWNYGRGMRPDDPRVGYERRVDYCSAAALLVDGTLLRNRGGFDERYRPAYYEDTDLCFAIREAGREVWYQPASIVVHLEGQSHGTDTASGVKKHQAINQAVFRARHAAALELQQEPGPASVGVARERVRGRVIVIDNEVPTPDRDSGSLRQFSLMQSIVESGWGVTFLPVNGWRREPYTSRLERAGVEVLGTQDQWWPHLAEIAASVTHVWLSRPDVTRDFLDKFRTALPDATIVYDTVDLHFLREQRGAEVLQDPFAASAARRFRELEIGLMRQADRVVVVSPVEQDLLRAEEWVESDVVPNVHQRHHDWVSPALRDGLLMVGSFRHPPNVDAAKWLATEILPIVRQLRPEVTLRLVGADAPPSVLALAELDGVEVVGWVADLTPEYARARVVVAPLRFGAGLKGKVGEALAYGVPLVLTPIAAEGMDLVHEQHALVHDDVGGFASSVVRLIDDDSLWRVLSAGGREFAAARYSPEAVGPLVRRILDNHEGEQAAVERLPELEPDQKVQPSSADDLLADAERQIAALETRLAAQSHRLGSADEATRVLTHQLEALRRSESISAVVVAADDRFAGERRLLEFERDELLVVVQKLLYRAREVHHVESSRSYAVARRVGRWLRRGRQAQAPAATEADAQRLALLAASGMVDRQWYLAAHPDVAAAGRDPFDHYTTQGWKELRSPGPQFDTAWYVATYPDVLDSGIDPAVHYLVWGWQEGRLPAPWFYPDEYLRRHGLSEGDVCPIVHQAALRPGAIRRDRESQVRGVLGVDALAPAAPGLDRRDALVGQVVATAARGAAPPRVTPSTDRVDLLHLHGFKCAGQTFAWILERNFPDQVVFAESQHPGERLAWQRVADEVSLTGARAVSSHLCTLPPVGAGVATLTVAFVRQPRARLLSAYRHDQATGAVTVGDETFAEYLTRVERSGLLTYQVRHLSPQGPPQLRPDWGWDLLPDLIDLERDDLFIGVVERFDESMILLEHRLAALGIDFDGSYGIVHNAARGELVPADTTLSADLSGIDEALYRRVDAALKARWDAFVLEHPEAMKDFRRRCQAVRTSGLHESVSLKYVADWVLLPSALPPRSAD